MSEAKTRGRARLVVRLDRLTENYRYLAAHLEREHTRPIAVVKANAYGHGAIPIAKALAAAGARRFAVATVDEGLALRSALPHADILVLGYVPEVAVAEAARAALTLSVYSTAYAHRLVRAAKGLPLAVEVKVNSGMNRLGFSLSPAHFEASVRQITALACDSRLRVCGIFSHLATADEENSPMTACQLALFRRLLSVLSKGGLSLPAHIAASAAVLSGEARGFPLARLGLALYGYSPLRSEAGLLPVARLEADIIEVYTIARGESVGYGATFRARRRERIGIIPIGYADGLLRATSGALVTVAGHACPIIGRVSMDFAALLLTGVPARDCRLCTLFGEDSAALYRLAAAAGTIPYEILAGLGTRIDRIYENEENGHLDTE